MTPSDSHQSLAADQALDQVLDLDRNLNRLAILEALQLLRQLATQLPTRCVSQTLAQRAILRLTYTLAHSPDCRLDPAHVLALQSHAQHHLASSLEQAHDQELIHSILRNPSTT